MKRSFFQALLALSVPTAIFASPMIQVDTPDVKLGNFIEGQTKGITHVFKVKNTGDSALVIQQVRPG